ncbi:hypothetical protein [Ornithinimicrobium cryptoxanthini]|uniref:hypothetical protein n=1 Tax=Ornithinimicrobium cryptoxanthini TaxID=2934161 RepID=UPI002FC82493
MTGPRDGSGQSLRPCLGRPAAHADIDDGAHLEDVTAIEVDRLAGLTSRRLTSRRLASRRPTLRGPTLCSQLDHLEPEGSRGGRAPITSSRRSGAPGAVTTARSPTTTSASSMKTLSGCSGAGSTSTSSKPAADSAEQ